jgi:BRCT domain type II-containing protein
MTLPPAGLVQITETAVDGAQERQMDLGGFGAAMALPIQQKAIDATVKQAKSRFMMPSSSCLKSTALLFEIRAF